ncbi:DEAD/DEAH box helicase [Rhodoferax saidenbachensis]|uniref:Superfamily II DNA/RNA helicase n=1 Tax=Rhodoferax saidenbachensis TaxID=1484693 RepID=A0ABU1ZMU6_9BURK|nr:DEAD/DEAH box helicase [Rhodoferax saidenbachensis]MDR7306803.1 superfamily II DNA/RNA helicase [Rhodoferax saidenbachensis]
MPFSDLGIPPALAHAMVLQGYVLPTPVQAQTVPVALDGKDVLACAQTGSGKTAAYAMVLLAQLTSRTPHKPRQATALVVVPTRELATQVGDTLRTLAQHAGQAARVTVLFGGVSINPQLMGLRGGTDIVVATPGRLLDVVDHRALTLGGVQTLVLDEADRLLDLGFAQELDRIRSLLPARHQSLLYSATFPAAVRAMAQASLHSPVEVNVVAEEGEQPDIAQRAIQVDVSQRTQLLRHLIAEQGWSRVLVFVATKYAAEMVADKLRRAGLLAEPFHAQLSQGKRTQVLMDFKASAIGVVVATDVAARGIDISDLPVVVNYDLPRSATDYTHRIGRTARAGASGLAVSFVTADMEAHFRLIEKRHRKLVPREQVPGFEPAPRASDAPGGTAGGGIKGIRPSKKDKLRAAGLLPPLA